MTRLQRVAVLTKLTEKLHESGSWCGETHLQKAAYFLQELFNVLLVYEFILYKHGPFSFALRDELSSIYADGLLRLQPKPPPYGPTIVTTPQSAEIFGRFARTLGEHERQIEFVATWLGNKKVSTLEGLATAMYVWRELGTQSTLEERAEKLHSLKPHVSEDQALDFLRQVERLASEASSVR